jgi:hypothetical protein
MSEQKIEAILALGKGDSIWFDDPDNEECSGIITLGKPPKRKGYTVLLECEQGSVTQAHYSELQLQ